MKNLLFFGGFFLALSAFKTDRYTDDTATLQAQINATTNLVLPSGHGNYYTSSVITIPTGHSVNWAGNFVNTSQPGGAVIKMQAGSSMTGGTLQGNWIVTSPGNAGASGIQILGSGVSITNMRILGYSSYGIVCGAFSNLVISNNVITKTGYIGFYFDAEANGTTNNTFTNNTIDRSDVPASTILEACADIRASVSNNADTSFNWNISGNTFIMPANPHAVTNEGIEVRRLKNSVVNNNKCINNSIGISVATCYYTNLSHNKTTNTTNEGIEIFGSVHCKTFYNSVNTSAQTGILIDGVYTSGGVSVGIPSRLDTLNFDTVRGGALSAVELYTNTNNIVFNGSYLTTTTIGVNFQKADSITFNNVTIDGLSHAGTAAIELDFSLGNVKYNLGKIINCIYAFKAYNTNTGAVVNNLIGSNVDLTGTSTQFYGIFTNGAHFGTNIRFNTLSFGTIASRTYGAADFDPGAVSGLGITYTSGNTAVATIVSGKIHIIGVGTSTITANNGDMILTQPVVISKAPLTITADDKAKAYGAVNPALTAHYSTFQYGQDHTVLTAQPVLTTIAVTGSAAGPYLITVSGATAANYSIVFQTGTLTINPPITGGGAPPVIRKRRARIKN